MIKNYFKIAWRNLLRHKGFSLLNIFGLAIGITCCLLIFQYVSYEKSYDTFHAKADQIVRLRLDIHDQGKLTMQSATVFAGFAPTMKKDFPEVENYCRLIDARIAWSDIGPTQYNIVFSNDDRNISALENMGYYADPSTLDMFTIPLVYGDPKLSLSGPDMMIISESLAKKYFAQDNPVGKKLTIREGGQVYYYEVTGVFKNYPENSHLAFDYLISYKTFDNLIRFLSKGKGPDPETNLGWYDYYDYLQLRPGTNWKLLESKLPAFCDHYLNGQPWNKTHNVREDLFMIPLKDIHLYSNYNEEARVNGDYKSVYFLFIVAFIIIIIAWVNYSNLATARSLERAKEVGVRKVLGALRKDLIGQFLTESFLLNLFALIVATGLTFFLTPYFNQLIGGKTTSWYLSGSYLKGFIFLFLVGAFISGLYPAFVLSGYHPIAVLKGLFKNSFGGIFIRKGLIVGQFATSIVLITGTIIVYQQVNFMRNQQLGANINQTLVLNGAGSVPDSTYKNSFTSFKNDLLEINGVKNITSSSSVLGKEIYYTSEVELIKAGAVKAPTFYIMYVDDDFIPAYDMNLKAGRNFSKKFSTDNKAVILNEQAVKLFGFDDPQKSTNELVKYGNDTLKIIGVVSDFHQQGLNKAINPIIFILDPAARSFYSIKFNTADISRTIASIEKIWEKNFPADPFNYFFLNESFDHQYKNDQQFGKVFGMFSFLAIIIACFGLLGLSAYNILQRTKEIGIRKVLGASVPNIITLLSKDFLKLIVIAFFIASPLAWYFMNNWLQGFAYRINISWWVFLIGGILALLIALFTISFQAIKAAIANPVKSLRTE